MKKNRIVLCIAGLCIIFFSMNCTAKSQYNFLLKNTLSIFLFNNGNDYYFAIPIQYIGDYTVENFEFDSGYIILGEYKIALQNDNLSIEVFVNEHSDEYGNTDGLGNLNQYNIFVEYILKNNDMENIINEYKKGNMYSQFYLEYTITIDNEKMEGCGYSDDFELYNVLVQDTSSLQYDWFPPNLNFFRQMKNL